MNIGYMCKTFPKKYPHELLGFSENSLNGTLLTFMILQRMNEEEAKQMDDKSGQSSRRAKFNRLK